MESSPSSWKEVSPEVSVDGQRHSLDLRNYMSALYLVQLSPFEMK